MSQPFDREWDVAVAAVRQAAALCRDVQRELKGAVLEKDDKSPVTIADFGSQALICRALQDAFPSDPVIGEEDAAALREAGQSKLLARVAEHVSRHAPGATAERACAWIDRGGAQAFSSRFWTLDPIDGTKGFLRGEQYAVALALLVDGQVTVAAVACPNLPPQAGPETGDGVIFSAVRGRGAWTEPLSGGPRGAIRARASGDAAQARYCESVESRHSSQSDAARVAEALGIVLPPRRLDSMAKYALVARGEADLYMRLPTGAKYQEKIWDHAAGALVATEAGATVSDIEGKPLDFTHGRELLKNRGILTTNGPLHRRALEAIRNLPRA